ncbi:MAG: carboxypeptidase regulatory-like domain-containing protein [Myxococcaceae bacterium]|nr:carboxypeptidase regulatory-like domain-containing protein [Myxococcaceae bacterium]
MNRRLVVALAVVATGCLELALPPPPPPPGPGTIQGTLVHSVSGKTEPAPSRGAVVSILDSSLSTVVDEEGRFLLAGIDRTRGQLYFRLDLDGDGTPDRQRLITLESIAAGPGRDVSLGQVVLGRNARVIGRALREDLPGDAFHLGTTVFIAGTVFNTFTADNGGFTLDALPEGAQRVTFFRTNYLAETRDVVLSAGEEKRLVDVMLIARPSEAATGTGLVLSADGPIEGALVKIAGHSGTSVTARTGADGRFTVGPVPAGSYLVGVEKSGFVTALLGWRLFTSGTQDLGTVRLASGQSISVELDAGRPPPQPDGGTGGGSAAGGTAGGGSAGGGSTGGGSTGGGSTGGGSTGGGSTGGGSTGGGSTGGGSTGGGSGGGSAGGGSTGGGSAGGATAGGSTGGGSAGGATAGGAAGGGPIDAGTPDAGAPLSCAGACADGRACTADVECRTTACGLTSCAGACNDGRCYGSTCGTMTCGVGEVCDGMTCRALACAGVSCGSSAQCAAGRCLSRICRFGTCAPGTLCVNGACLDVRCVDVECGPGATCVGGMCLPVSSQSGTPCAPGFVFLGGRCTDVACEGMTCPAGSVCRTGQCNPAGLFIAGLLYPEGRTNLSPETVVATLGPTGWQRLNVTVLPPVLQLSVSPTGQWLFALTDDVPASGNPEGSLWRSADGIGWTKVFDGASAASSGAISSMAWELATSTLFVSINGGPANFLNGSLTSSDDGTTWQRRIFTPGGYDFVWSVSPQLCAVPYTNFGNAGLFPNDGGTRLPYFSPAEGARLFYDNRGIGPSMVGSGDLRLVADGGHVAPISPASQDSIVYGPDTRLFVTSSSTVWFSLDNGLAWGQRALPITPTVALAGITRGADGALVVGNRNAQPPLFSSPDDGLTWAQLGHDWYAIPELSDPVPAWQPDASYGFTQRVRPRVPNGWIYERWVGNSPTSGPTEPTWSTDGGDVREPSTDIWWRPSQRHLGLRVTALTSRECSSGRMRCGAACVDITSSATDCGACGRTCAGVCRNGGCVLADAGVGAAGCADGTREGFVDDVAWPDLAACRGTWSGDLSSAADALCGAGFHVCTNTDAELATVRTVDALAFPGCFAYRASNDRFDGCEPLECQGNPDRDDMAGMGRGCLLLSGVQHAPAAVPDGGASCLADRGRIDAQCCAISVSVPGSGRAPGCRQRSEDGVVCCRD